jgi:hypothetical protein
VRSGVRKALWLERAGVFCLPLPACFCPLLIYFQNSKLKIQFTLGFKLAFAFGVKNQENQIKGIPEGLRKYFNFLEQSGKTTFLEKFPTFSEFLNKPPNHKQNQGFSKFPGIFISGILGRNQGFGRWANSETFV